MTPPSSHVYHHQKCSSFVENVEYEKHLKKYCFYKKKSINEILIKIWMKTIIQKIILREWFNISF